MIECTKYTPLKKGFLLGFANIYVEKWGGEICGITLYQKDGKRWINLPGGQYEKDGEKKFAPFFRFREMNHYKIFTEEVKKAIDRKIAKDYGQRSHEFEQTLGDDKMTSSNPY